MAAGIKQHICIKSLQYAPGIDEPMATCQEVDAEFYQKGDTLYLFYEEQLDAESSPEETCKTRVKYKNGVLEVQRQGKLTTTMRFEKNTTFRTDYPTAFGVLVLDIVTEDIMLEGEITGELTGWPKMTVCYQLENEGETLSRFELQMLAKH